MDGALRTAGRVLAIVVCAVAAAAALLCAAIAIDNGGDPELIPGGVMFRLPAVSRHLRRSLSTTGPPYGGPVH